MPLTLPALALPLLALLISPAPAPPASPEAPALTVTVETPPAPSAAPGRACTVTVAGRHGGAAGEVEVAFSESQVRTRVGWWARLAGGGERALLTLRPGQSFSEAFDLDLGCNAHRRYRFVFTHDGSEHTHVYPSEDGFTQETFIDLGAVSRFFGIEPGADAEPQPVTLEGLDLDGEWVRAESTYDPNDGMRIAVDADRATITAVPSSAHGSFEEGVVIWRDITADGALHVFGSDRRYYPARLSPEGHDRLHVDIAHNGAGNDQTWVREGPACRDGVVQLDPAVAALVDPVVEEEMAIQELVGLAVGVIRNGRIVHLKGYGYADRESETPVTEETLFRWASISKTITAVAAMAMWEDGHLDLDADVSAIVPEFEDKPDGVITMRQLLSNTSGVAPYPSGWRDRARRYPSASVYDPIAALDVLSGSLLFTPGDDYRYSTMGFMLAGAVLNRIAEEEYGLPTGTHSSAFEEFVQTRIADPLCLTTLQNDYPLVQSPLDARRYAKDRNGVIYRVQDDSDEVIHWRLPGGGYQSTITDLALFANGLFSGDILGENGYARLTTEVRTNDGSATGYAQGLYVSYSGAGTVNRLGHGGVQRGVRTHMYHYPGQDVTVVFLSNSSHTDRNRLRDRIVNALGSETWSVNGYDLIDHIRCDTIPPTSPYTRFAGVWRTDSGAPDQILRRGYFPAPFQEERQRLAGLGYHLTDLETYTTSLGDRRWDGVFTRGAPRTRTWRNADLGTFLDKVDEWAREGWRLVDVETYVGEDADLPIRNEARLWAGLFVQEASDYELEHSLSTSAFHAVWEARSNNGFRLVDVETYEGPDGTRQWAGVFVRGHGGYGLYRDVRREDVRARMNDLRREGLRIIDVEVYRGAQGQRLWAFVGRASTRDEEVRIDKPFCGTWDGPLTGFWETHQDALSQGRSLADFERYPD